MASFTHFRATLVDVATLKVVESSASTGNLITSVASLESGSSHPWATLTPAQKMAQLRDLIEREVGRMVPDLIGIKP